MVEPGDDDDGLLEKIQKDTFAYFLKETNPANGLVADKTRTDWPPASPPRALHLPLTLWELNADLLAALKRLR